jgi:hypothetical protein
VTFIPQYGGYGAAFSTLTVYCIDLLFKVLFLKKKLQN